LIRDWIVGKGSISEDQSPHISWVWASPPHLGQSKQEQEERLKEPDDHHPAEAFIPKPFIGFSHFLRPTIRATRAKGLESARIPYLLLFPFGPHICENADIEQWQKHMEVADLHDVQLLEQPMANGQFIEEYHHPENVEHMEHTRTGVYPESDDEFLHSEGEVQKEDPEIEDEGQ
jgi:hypothetical protein